MNKKLFKFSSACLCLLMALVFALAIPSTTQAASTGKVTNVRQTADGYTPSQRYAIELQFTPASNAIGYTAKLSTDNVHYSFIDWNETSTSSRIQIGSVTTLTRGATYYVKIIPCYRDTDGSIAFNEDGASAPIQVVTAPKEVASSGFYQTKASTKTVTAKWDSVAGATGYNVYVKKYGTGDWSLAGTTTSKSFTVKKMGGSKLAADTCYSVAVCPIKKSSAGYTAEASGSGKPFYTVPNATKKVLGTWKPDSKQLTIAWANGSCVDGYELQFYNVKGKLIKKANVTAKSVYTFAKAPKNSTVSVRLRSYTKTTNGKKLYSNWSSKTYFIAQAKPTSSYNSATNQLSVKWSKVTGAKKYIVYAGTSSNSMKKVATVGSGTTSYTFSKINGSPINTYRHYYIKVVPQGKFGGKTVKGDYNYYLEVYWTTRYY